MVTLTLKQNSKNSLKQWVNQIKRYEVQLPLLYEKLEYLEVRSIGYNSPSFEPRLSSNSSSSYKGIDYWLEKIDACERQIKKYENEINKYKFFFETLGELEQTVLYQYFYINNSAREVLKNENIQRYQIYESIKKINKLYFNKI